jgi:hypothetical protein
MTSTCSIAGSFLHEKLGSIPLERRIAAARKMRLPIRLVREDAVDAARGGFEAEREQRGRYQLLPNHRQFSFKKGLDVPLTEPATPGNSMYLGVAEI